MKNKIYLILLLFVIINLLITLFFIWPLIEDVSKQSGKLIETNNKVFTFNEQIKRLDDFYSNKDAYINNFQFADQMLVDAKNPILIIKFIENTALQSDVSLDISLIPNSNNKINGDSWPSIQFQVTSIGSFANTLKFLNKLENAPYLISIQDLKISENEDITKSKNNSEVKIKTVYQIKVFTK